MLIYKTKGKITTANDKTNLTHKFDVPDNMRLLKIKYCYSPKTLEDREKAVMLVRNCFGKYDETIVGRPADYLPVKNLITISVNANGTYIGAAHRQSNNQEHIISKAFSSPGFIKSDILSGDWDIVLNVHSISCDVDYTIEVEGEKKE